MSMRVLVVEDSTSFREVVAIALRSRGYDVDETGDGADGWKKARAGGYHCILLDAMLPNKTGFEICQELKSNPKTCNAAVIMMTAVTQGSGKSDEYWKQQSKADEFLTKPFKMADLIGR